MSSGYENPTSPLGHGKRGQRRRHLAHSVALVKWKVVRIFVSRLSFHPCTPLLTPLRIAFERRRAKVPSTERQVGLDSYGVSEPCNGGVVLEAFNRGLPQKPRESHTSWLVRGSLYQQVRSLVALPDLRSVFLSSTMAYCRIGSFVLLDVQHVQI